MRTMLLALKLSSGAFIASSKSGISPRRGVPGADVFGEASLDAASAAGFFAAAFDAPAFGALGFADAIDASSSLFGQHSDSVSGCGAV